MPQTDRPIFKTETGKTFQLAQGPEEGRTPGVPETHAETKGAEEKGPQPGEIPDPHLLFANSLLVAGGLIVFALAARSKLSAIPKGFQNFAEFVAEALNNFTVGIVGPEGKKYTPLVGTVFLYILFMNLIGIIPGFHSPTGNLSVTLALGLVVFVYVQYEGIRQNGLGGYVKHFMGPMPALAPLIGFIELISEFIKPITLGVRLFGNIFGEDVIIVVLAGLMGLLGVHALGWLPLQIPVLFLSVITDVVQAMVFSILTCIYLSLMQPHGHEEHGEGEHGAAHATGH